MYIRFIHTLLAILFVCSFLASEALGGLPLSNKPGIELFFYSNGSPTQFIIVEKRTQTLKLFEQGNSLKLLKKLTCATGEHAGTKQISGDAKTPEGVYFITEVFQDNEITVFGSRAFHLDYPNIFDKYAGHNGDGIFIHGTNKNLAPYSTNGCITLNNQDLDELAPYLTVQTIPVIIVDSLEKDPIQRNFSMLYGDPAFTAVMDTLGLSARDLRPDQIEKLQFFKVGDQGLALIRYDEFDANSMQFKYDKHVYLKPSLTKNWRTLFATHEQDMIPSLVAIYPIKKKGRAVKVIAKEQTPVPKQPLTITNGEELLDFVEKWRKAWSNKDIEVYMDCYSQNFKSSGLDKKGWRNKKTYLNKKYKFIQVTIDNIVIERTKDRAKISFFQTYQSDLYETSGTKNLQLVKENGNWMIEKEYM
ncbi:L,D-transpeptidase family protein [Desulforhopalus sp. 52FAK]